MDNVSEWLWRIARFFDTKGIDQCACRISCKPKGWEGSFAFVLFAILCVVAPETSFGTNQTLRLDGNTSRVVVENASELNPSAAITIEAWVRPTTISGCQAIVSKSYQNGYWLGICNGRIRYYANGTGTNIDGNNVIPVGKWTHIAVSFDRTTRRYYIDGVLDKSQVTPAEMPVNIINLGIGGDVIATISPFGSTFYEFSGDIAEVRIWDIARSQTEIRDNISFQLDPPIDGLVSVWHFQGGSGDGAGLFTESLEGLANFLGETAPPVRFDPVQIPRLAAYPVIDGTCEGLYSKVLRVPFYQDDAVSGFNPGWAYIGATAGGLYVCMENMPYGTGTTAFASVYIDNNANGGSVAQTDDFRINVHSDTHTFETEFGTGTGGFAEPGPVGPQAVGNFTASEFEWSAEFIIGRSLLASSSGGNFGLELIHHWHDRVGDDHGWPIGFVWISPNTWEAASIDDTTDLPHDTANPDTRITHRPENPAPSDTISFEAEATDDSSIVSISIYLDSNLGPVEICDITPPSSPATCTFNTSLPVGFHRYRAVATDIAGRQQSTEQKSLRVIVDGEAPQVELSHTPDSPTLGALVTLSATASDPSGIASIDLTTDTVPSGYHCDFPARPTVANCTLTDVTPRWGGRVIRYTARAVDSEGLETRPGRRTVLFGNTGFDGDGDGLSDSIEAFLCTLSDRIDTDRDGLKDGWEVLGLSFADGSRVELPELGANPCMRDVFLQYDYEKGARVEPTVVESIVSAFRRHRVNLHVTENERPRPTSSDISPLFTEAAAYQKDAEGNFWFDPKLLWTHYYAYSHHIEGRSWTTPPYVNYQIYVSSGCSCPLSTTDPSICGSGRLADPSTCRRESAMNQTLRFMHELGHDLGLGHGGRNIDAAGPIEVGDYMYYGGEWDVVNHKPNYISVMNYLTNGNVCMVPGAVPNFVTDLTYSEENLSDLDETVLDERTSSSFATLVAANTCPMATPGAVPIVPYTCSDQDESNAMDLDLSPAARRTLMLSDGRQTQFRLMHGSLWSAMGWSPHSDGIDWNCDGAIDSSVSENINGNNGSGSIPLPPRDEICGNGIDDGAPNGVDEGCGAWTADLTLRAHADWGSIPSTPRCRIVYDDRRGSMCYPQIEEYRNAIPGDLPDCRPSGDPTTLCPWNPSSTDGSGLGPPIPEGEGDYLPPPPGLEACNMVDDDGDGEIDEGCRDTDGDGISDGIDNCPETPNADQADHDKNQLGDVCEIPPSVEQLAYSIDPNNTIILTWKHPRKDIIGFNVYRESTGTPTPAFMGGDVFPSTENLTLSDLSTGENGNIIYTVYPVNLNGIEGQGTSVLIEGDFDGDGVKDNDDDCVFQPNGPLVPDAGGNVQWDTDNDGYGNLCDGDLNNDGSTNTLDLNLYKASHRTSVGDANYNANADFNGDGTINTLDLNIYKELHRKPPGPSCCGTL